MARAGEASLPRVLNVLFRALRASHFASRRGAGHGKVTKALAPTSALRVPSTPSSLQGYGTTGLPWPDVPLAASLRLSPFHDDSARPSLTGRVDQKPDQEQIKAALPQAGGGQIDDRCSYSPARGRGWGRGAFDSRYSSITPPTRDTRARSTSIPCLVPRAESPALHKTRCRGCQPGCYQPRGSQTRPTRHRAPARR